MSEESAADRQAAQQAREQEKKYADSATAVSPDTQYADPSRATDADATGESARGTSTVFGEPDQERAEDRAEESDSDTDQRP